MSRSYIAFLITFVLVIVLGVSGFKVSYSANCNSAIQSAAQNKDVEKWMRTEFELNDAQVAKIKTLQANYLPQCNVHCEAIKQAQAKADDTKLTPQERIAARKEAQRMEGVCSKALMAHFEEVAAVMKPEHGVRYLKIMSLRIGCALPHDNAQCH